MKRTLTLIGILILAVAAQSFGQCPGGNCSRAAYWPGWGYYYSNPTQAGKCNTEQTTKPQTENGGQDPMPEPPADPETIVAVTVSDPCQAVMDLINQTRARYGLHSLLADETLCRACDSHSAYMRSYGFGHAWNSGLECIACGVALPQAVVSLWLNSSGHRAILLGHGSRIGVGFSGTFWTLRVR